MADANLIDWAAVTRAVVPIEAECLDCDKRWGDSDMRMKALAHSAEERHFVCIASRPMTEEEQRFGP